MPWEVESRIAIKQIVLTGASYKDVTNEHLGSAIDCGSSPPSPTSSNCIGLGFIRGVDSKRHVPQLLTPVPPAKFSKCITFVKGELDMPVWGFLDFRQDTTAGVTGVKWEKVPYLQMGGDDVAIIEGMRRKGRKNLMRRS
ncbi:hypothetical protein M422DRAFT_783960 [Sphaerobolus stellatus SS14]|uniref:Uncharacterized protein n=1 Tax=Sphaerobolus stellatus (strain SS14) TaxID=990650 RepID=A0A0C9UYN7_SPHS4|nr:hypothetical protein M422DRAFT_783960 [Sphaerobolus stellatus SS14]